MNEKQVRQIKASFDDFVTIAEAVDIVGLAKKQVLLLVEAGYIKHPSVLQGREKERERHLSRDSIREFLLRIVGEAPPIDEAEHYHVPLIPARNYSAGASILQIVNAVLTGRITVAAYLGDTLRLDQMLVHRLDFQATFKNLRMDCVNIGQACREMDLHEETLYAALDAGLVSLMEYDGRYARIEAQAMSDFLDNYATGNHLSKVGLVHYDQ